MIVLAAFDDDLADALARIAEALHVPVLILALVVLAAAALELGRFLIEVWRRRATGGAHALRDLAESCMNSGTASSAPQAAPSAAAGAAVVQMTEIARAGRPDELGDALADYELAVQRRLDRTRILVRAGPAVGLIGTLIPLAPGLTALGDGHVAELAIDLRTAFAATVLGLVAGTVAFALTITRTRMYSEDLTALERAAAKWTRRREAAAPGRAVAPITPLAPLPGDRIR